MKLIKLDDVCEINIGQTPARKNNLYWGKGHNWVSISDMNSKYISKTKEQITDLAIKETNIKLVPKGTVIMSFKLTIGKVAIAAEPLYTNEAIAHFIPKDENILSEYLYYVLQFIDYEPYINKSAKGKTLNKKSLKKVKLPVFDLNTQKKIVKVLDQVSKTIDIRNKQLLELDNLVKSIFFKTINNANYKNISFGDAFDLIDGDRGKNYPKKYEFTDNGYCLFLNTKNVTKKGFAFENKEFISKEKDEVLKNGKVKYGDFILTTRGTVGNITYYNEKIPYENIRINSGMLILRPKIEIDERYFQILIRELPLLESALSGSAQPQLPKGKLSVLEFPIIDQNKQILFSKKIKEIESIKEKMQKSLNELNTLFDALMQKSFTGKLV